MRVPNQLQGGGALSHVGRIRTEANRASSEIASGLRVQKPSDDPIAAAKSTLTKDRLDRLAHYRDAAGRAEDDVLALETTLDQLERLMDVAASAAARGRSGVAPAVQFQALAEEVDGVRDDVLRLANTRHSGESIFAGRQTKTQAFVETAGVVTYQGDTLAASSRVGDQTAVETTIPGDGLFVTGTDIFQVLGDLRDALAAEDVDRVAIEMQNVEQVSERFNQFRARVGHTLDELSRHAVHLRSEQVLEQTDLSREIDADLVDAISRLNSSETALQATLGAGARLLSVSLLDVLG